MSPDGRWHHMWEMCAPIFMSERIQLVCFFNFTLANPAWMNKIDVANVEKCWKITQVVIFHTKAHKLLSFNGPQIFSTMILGADFYWFRPVGQCGNEHEFLMKLAIPMDHFSRSGTRPNSFLRNYQMHRKWTEASNGKWFEWLAKNWILHLDEANATLFLLHYIILPLISLVRKRTAFLSSRRKAINESLCWATWCTYMRNICDKHNFQTQKKLLLFFSCWKVKNFIDEKYQGGYPFVMDAKCTSFKPVPRARHQRNFLEKTEFYDQRI